MAERIRILSLVSSLCFGGAEKHAVALLNHLPLERYSLSLAYLKPDVALLAQIGPDRVESSLSVDVRRRIDWPAVRRLAEFIDAQHIDIVLCTNEYAALYALLARGRSQHRPRLVEVFHTTLLRSLKERLQLLLYRHVFRRFDLLVYVSHNQHAYWKARHVGAQRDIVIHNGVDPDRFTDRYTATQKSQLRASLGFADSDYVAAICAALRPEKAHGDFLQALAQVRSRGVPARGLLIGDGPERRTIEAAIERLGLLGSVVITGFQSDVRPFVACCDVLVLASHAVETLSVAALEGMALGKPTLLSRIGGADELVVNGVNGYLFEPGDIDGLVQRLAELERAETRLPMGVAAATRARELFTERRMIAAFAEQFELLAPGDRTRMQPSCAG